VGVPSHILNPRTPTAQPRRRQRSDVNAGDTRRLQSVTKDSHGRLFPRSVTGLQFLSPTDDLSPKFTTDDRSLGPAYTPAYSAGTSKSSPLVTNLKIAKRKQKHTKRPAYLSPRHLPMKFSNILAVALVAVLISPTIASAKKKPGKDKGKLTETKITVFLATDEALGDSEGPDGLALAFLEDDLVYSFNKVQEGNDLQGVSSHFIGKAPEDAGGDLLFPELSESLRGSGLGYWKG
jgi:hypothetical protein